MTSNSSQSVALTLPSSKGVVILGGQRFEYIGVVTRTVLKQEDGVPFYVEFQGPIEPSSMNPEFSKYKNKAGEGVVPEVADVLNLETGECQTLIVNAVLSSEIQRAYPLGAYVGRLFGIRRGPSELDKRYKVYTIIEVRRVP